MVDCILGAGLAGLIWGACHPQSLIIERGSIGGMVHNNLGPMMIKHTRQSEEFVNSLGMDVMLKEIVVGYTYGLQTPTAVQPQGFKEQYISHSRKLPISEIDKSEHKSMMNSAENSFLVIELNMQEFIDAMVDKIGRGGGLIMTGSVTDISCSDNRLSIKSDTGPERRMTYDSLVSTLPMYVLRRLISEEGSKCFPHQSELNDYVMHKVFLSLKGIDAAYIREKFAGLDFVYSIPAPLGYVSEVSEFLTRVILTGDDPVLEFTVPINTVVYTKFLSELSPELTAERTEFNISELSYSMIRKNIAIKECEGIKMVGRYSQWDHSIRLHDIMAEAMK